MFTNQFVRSRKARMIGAGIGCALGFAVMSTSLHADTNRSPAVHASPAPLATSGSCEIGQKTDGTHCVEPVSIVHIDAAPAFACLTPDGAVGDRRVAGVCTNKPEVTADSAVDLAVQPSTR
jgi:hypothetical protein